MEIRSWNAAGESDSRGKPFHLCSGERPAPSDKKDGESAREIAPARGGEGTNF